MNKTAQKSIDSRATIGTHDDGKFVRTAIKVDHTSSLQVLDDEGKVVAQVNIFLQKGKFLVVDVIDTEKVWTEPRAVAFSQKERATVRAPEGGRLVSAHFESKKEGEG